MVSDAESDSGFEEIYARAGGDLETVPWASMTAHPALSTWLGARSQVRGQRGLVIGCGLGDDAEALSRHGYEVSAFDIAPSAIAACQERFPASKVAYGVADLFALSDTWWRNFDLVVEIRTLQSLPITERARAARAIADTVRPGGLLWVRSLARKDPDAGRSRPWPVTHSELDGFVCAGLYEIDFQEEPPTAEHSRSFTALYRRKYPETP